MTANRTNASDASYHSRHARRTLQRAERILENIPDGARVLDVGCNNGITSQFLLDSGKVSHVTGIELLASTVDEPLKEHPDFRLIEGNIVDLELDENYDVVIYGAVHHHILNFNGLAAAIATMQKLVRHCDGRLFFETGQAGEGGRWGWQRAARRFFRTDEEHFCYLLRSIEHDISAFSIIGKFWIHGIRRSYLRIDMKERGKGVITVAADPELPGDAEGPFARSFGSRDQQILPATDAAVAGSPTRFWKSNESGKFFKQHRHHPIAAAVEHSIGEHIHHAWAVTSAACDRRTATLEFPLLGDAVPLAEYAKTGKRRRALAQQVRAVHRDATTTALNLNDGAVMRTGNSVIDVCDLNINNLMVTESGDTVTLNVVDFEQQGVAYGWRNRMHFARTLWLLRESRFKAMTEYFFGVVSGVVRMLAAQTLPFEERIRRRQPSLVSLLVADVRTLSGRVLGRILAAAGIKDG